jgi:hypothetical protein
MAHRIFPWLRTDEQQLDGARPSSGCTGREIGPARRDEVSVLVEQDGGKTRPEIALQSSKRLAFSLLEGGSAHFCSESSMN